MSYSTIIFEKKNGMAKITLNRPDKLNALNSIMREELGDAMAAIGGDESISVLLTTGAGRAYCAGMDLNEPDGVLEGFKSPGTGSVQFFELVHQLPVPTIAAVNGFAVTGGLELALAHDILIASDDAIFADTHAQLGLIPIFMAQMLHRAVGETKARLAIFAGTRLSAAEAYTAGMVAMVVKPDLLQKTAEEIAGTIASRDRYVLTKLKAMVNADRPGLEEGLKSAKIELNAHRLRSQSRSADTAARLRASVLKGKNR